MTCRKYYALEGREKRAKTVSKFIFFNLFAAFFNLFVSFFNLFVSFLNLFVSFLNLFVSFLNLSVSFFNLFAALFNLSVPFFNLFTILFSNKLSKTMRIDRMRQSQSENYPFIAGVPLEFALSIRLTAST
jgi:hypothetical protein